MSGIISMKNFKKSKTLEKDIYTYFSLYDPYFLSYLNDNKLIVIVNSELSFYFFLEYVDAGTFTLYPSLDDRYENIRLHPHTSTGEWVVQAGMELSFENSEGFLTTLPQTDDEVLLYDYIYRSFSPYFKNISP